jgi:hypothetical protein
VFRLNASGCYTLLVTRAGKLNAAFKLTKRTWRRVASRETVLIPWTPALDALARQGIKREQLKIESKGDRIKVWLNEIPAAQINDSSFREGQAGMAQFGFGRVQFHDLELRSLP